jgi:uncharacterized membrane protein YccF (DUF307 family)
MSTLGNILWIFIGGGLIIFLEYLFSSVILCATIIGIPFGLQCMKLSLLGLFPFGKEIVRKEAASGCLNTLMNIIWILVGGLWISLTHIISAFFCAITIIGIPFARQHIKMASLAISPFGHEVH